MTIRGLSAEAMFVDGATLVRRGNAISTYIYLVFIRKILNFSKNIQSLATYWLDYESAIPPW